MEVIPDKIGNVIILFTYINHWYIKAKMHNVKKHDIANTTLRESI